MNFKTWINGILSPPICILFHFTNSLPIDLTKDSTFCSIGKHIFAHFYIGLSFTSVQTEVNLFIYMLVWWPMHLFVQDKINVWTFYRRHTHNILTDEHTKSVTCVNVSRDGKTAITGLFTTSLVNLLSCTSLCQKINIGMPTLSNIHNISQWLYGWFVPLYS